MELFPIPTPESVVLPLPESVLLRFTEPGFELVDSSASSGAAVVASWLWVELIAWHAMGAGADTTEMEIFVLTVRLDDGEHADACLVFQCDDSGAVASAFASAKGKNDKRTAARADYLSTAARLKRSLMDLERTRLKALFEACDLDGDGCITRSEFRLISQILGRCKQPQRRGGEGVQEEQEDEQKAASQPTVAAAAVAGRQRRKKAGLLGGGAAEEFKQLTTDDDAVFAALEAALAVRNGYGAVGPSVTAPPADDLPPAVSVAAKREDGAAAACEEEGGETGAAAIATGAEASATGAAAAVHYEPDESDADWLTFAAYDNDGSGRMTLGELGDVASEAGVVATREQLQNMLGTGDGDGSGTLTFSEFKALMLRAREEGLEALVNAGGAQANAPPHDGPALPATPAAAAAAAAAAPPLPPPAAGLGAADDALTAPPASCCRCCCAAPSCFAASSSDLVALPRTLKSGSTCLGSAHLTRNAEPSASSGRTTLAWR
jgi:Ca2+-binding EF-hand superfamily protein